MLLRVVSWIVLSSVPKQQHQFPRFSRFSRSRYYLRVESSYAEKHQDISAPGFSPGLSAEPELIGSGANEADQRPAADGDLNFAGRLSLRLLESVPAGESEYAGGRRGAGKVDDSFVSH